MTSARATVVLAALAAAASLAVSATGAVAAMPHPCTGAVSAGGHHYVVHVDAVSCAFAKAWAGRLAGKRLPAHSINGALRGGPGGYKCTGTTSLGHTPTGVSPTTQVAGTCTKGGLTPSFNWIVSTGR